VVVGLLWLRKATTEAGSAPFSMAQVATECRNRPGVEWPGDGAKSWPGHHVRDLQHGGDPVDPNNIFPAEPSAHDLYNRAYPACYGGQPPWNTVGPDLPYTDI
jgi:hypothetical protein